MEKTLLQQLLNAQFRHVFAEGELDFLQGRGLGDRIAASQFCRIATLQEASDRFTRCRNRCRVSRRSQRLAAGSCSG
jgi:hypothetical protein